MANDPASLAAEALRAISDQPRNEGDKNPRPLSDPDTELVRRAASLLTQTERCVGILEATGDDLGGFRKHLPRLWGVVCYRTGVTGSEAAIDNLEVLGAAIRRARIIPNFNATVLSEVRTALQDLEELVRGNEIVSNDSRDQLLGLIAQAREACDQVDLVGPMSVDEALDRVAGGAIRFGDTAAAEQGTKERIADIIRTLLRTTAYAIPLEAISQGTQLAIGS